MQRLIHAAMSLRKPGFIDAATDEEARQPFIMSTTQSRENPARDAPQGASSSPHDAEEEEEEDEGGYTVDHLSAVVRPVALTMILARYAP